MNNTKPEVSQSWDVSCFLLLSFRWIVSSYWCRYNTCKIVCICIRIYVYIWHIVYTMLESPEPILSIGLQSFRMQGLCSVWSLLSTVRPVFWTYIRGWKMGTMVSSMWSFVFRTTMFAIHLPPNRGKPRSWFNNTSSWYGRIPRIHTTGYQISGARWCPASEWLSLLSSIG